MYKLEKKFLECVEEVECPRYYTVVCGMVTLQLQQSATKP